jgi:hypothetical protein
MMGYCYLLHLDRPLSEHHTAQHYLGFTKHVPSRMAAHLEGRGARFMQIARERGIGFQIARIWPGDRTFERKLKRRKQGPALCPICRRQAPADQLALDLSEDDLL